MRYPNLPENQQILQRLIDQLNQNEAFWRSLEPHRRARRKILRRLTKDQLHALDLLEFAALQPGDDCVGVQVGRRGIQTARSGLPTEAFGSDNHF